MIEYYTEVTGTSSERHRSVNRSILQHPIGWIQVKGFLKVNKNETKLKFCNFVFAIPEIIQGK